MDKQERSGTINKVLKGQKGSQKCWVFRHFLNAPWESADLFYLGEATMPTRSSFSKVRLCCFFCPHNFKWKAFQFLLAKLDVSREGNSIQLVSWFTTWVQNEKSQQLSDGLTFNLLQPFLGSLNPADSGHYMIFYLMPPAGLTSSEISLNLLDELGQTLMVHSQYI